MICWWRIGKSWRIASASSPDDGAAPADDSGSNATVSPVIVSAAWVSVIVPLAPVAFHAQRATTVPSSGSSMETTSISSSGGICR